MRPDPERVRLAAEALARARADAWARGERPGQGRNSSERTGVTADASLPASWSTRSRRDDPQSLNVAVGGMLSARGWRPRVAVAAVFGRWADIVGQQVAAHTKPEAFEDGELIVTADSPAWATQLRLLAPQVLKRLSQELGAGTVRHLKVRGPGGGSRGSGTRRHVRLRLPQEPVTTGKIKGSHADEAANGRGPTEGRTEDRTAPRDCSVVPAWLAVKVVRGTGLLPRQDGVSFVVRCAVDHGSRGTRGRP